MSKHVLITGASSGIGKAIALQLSKGDYKIAITSFHHPEALNQVADSIQKNGCSCIAMCGDIGDFSFAKSFVSQVLTQWGRIDTLINNAGMSYVGLLTDMTIADWNLIIQTNLTSVFNTCHSVIPAMVHEKSGQILNISSMWGEVGASCEVAYSASKGGINAFTKALGKELAPSGITVNALSLGVIDTPMNQCFSDEERQSLCDDIPLGRMGSPDEIAVFVKQLIDTNPPYLTGQVIRMDGGFI